MRARSAGGLVGTAARPNWVREELRAGGATLGCSLGLGSSTVAELLACAGFDWISIDTDHYAVDIGDVQAMLMASAATASIPLVRVPANDLNAIERALDIGAMGVVVPMITSAEEARGVVRATRYPPDGTRSFGPMRATRYYLDAEDYVARSTENAIVWLILETRGAVAELEEIAQTPGIDGVIIGPCDLSLALGLDPLRDNREVEEIAERALAVGRRTGLAIGINVASPEDLLRRREQGFTILDYGPDYRLLLESVRPALEALTVGPGVSRPTPPEPASAS